MLSVPRIAALNVLNSRLPAYRGVFGTFWEIHIRAPAGFVRVHTMAPKVDTGPILATAQVPLRYPLSFLLVMMSKKGAGGKLSTQLLRDCGAYHAGSPRTRAAPDQSAASSAGGRLYVRC